MQRARGPFHVSAMSTIALLLAVDAGEAQQTLPNGMTLPPGSTVLNPAATLRPFIVRPASGTARPGQAHTNVEIAIPQNGFPRVQQQISGPPFTGYLVETPASLGCVYGMVAVTNGCNPNQVTANPVTVSLPDALPIEFDYSTAAADLAAFDSQFGVAPATLHVVFGTGNPANGCTNGTQPPSGAGTGWDIEAALDIQTAHAIAPSATIYLVEANSSSFADLFNAVQVASACLQSAGGGQQSNSWGGSEFSGEQSFDQLFSATNVTYLASAGDRPGTEYPCTSPNVICVGGTTISRSGNTGFFQSEGVWNSDSNDVGTGGGPSLIEARPSYQNFLSSVVGSARGVPDLAADADPESGVWVYNSTYSASPSWYIVGGTSLASPLIAGVLNHSGFFPSSSNTALTFLYGALQAGDLSPFLTNITAGFCGYAHLDPSGNFPNAFNPNLDPQYTEAVSGFHWNFCAGAVSPMDTGNPNSVWARAARSVDATK